MSNFRGVNPYFLDTYVNDKQGRKGLERYLVEIQLREISRNIDSQNLDEFALES